MNVRSMFYDECWKCWADENLIDTRTSTEQTMKWDQVRTEIEQQVIRLNMKKSDKPKNKYRIFEWVFGRFLLLYAIEWN